MAWNVPLSLSHFSALVTFPRPLPSMPLPCEMVLCQHSALLLVQRMVLVLFHSIWSDSFSAKEGAGGTCTKIKIRNLNFLINMGWADISPLLPASLFSDANVLPKCYLPSCHLLLYSPLFSEFVDSLGGRGDTSKYQHMNPSWVNVRSCQLHTRFTHNMKQNCLFLLYFCSSIDLYHSSSSKVEGERTRGIITRWNTFNRGLTANLPHSYGTA